MQSADAAKMLGARGQLNALAGLFSVGLEPAPPPSPAMVRAMRRAKFSERLLEALARQIDGGLAALRRDGLGGCIAALDMIIRDKSIGAVGLPSPDRALASPEGLCGAVGDFSVGAMVEAYESGLYPSSHIGPLRWWAPRLRAVAHVAAFVTPVEASGRIEPGDEAKKEPRVAFDRTFETIIADKSLLPIAPALRWAFANLFDAGFAHSFQIFGAEACAIGEGFGIAVGDIFVIEALQLKKGKEAVGMAALAKKLQMRGFTLIDAKRFSSDWRALGFSAMDRDAYNAHLKMTLTNAQIGRWTEENRKKPRDYQLAA